MASHFQTCKTSIFFPPLESFFLTDHFFWSRHDVLVGLKRSYNDTYKSSRNLLGGGEWYCQQAYRALNQAAGVWCDNFVFFHFIYLFQSNMVFSSLQGDVFGIGLIMVPSYFWVSEDFNNIYKYDDCQCSTLFFNFNSFPCVWFVQMRDTDNKGTECLFQSG